MNIKMSNTMISLLLLYCIWNTPSVYLKKIEDISICLNGTDCEDTTDSNTYSENELEEETTALLGLSTTVSDTSTVTTNAIETNTTLITQMQNETISSTTPRSTVTPQKEQPESNPIIKTNTEICECDSTVAACDINCCCDTDCKEYQIKVFSHCKDYHAELYDSRYCYNRNFIDRNNTPFIIEKLANNLFCILYDNLPPTYSAGNNVIINNYKELKTAIKLNRSTWTSETLERLLQYNITNPYQDGSLIWKLQNNYVKPIELLQTGFTGLCSFTKKIKYLQNWKGSCMQSDLTNGNLNLFSAAFNNFSVVSSLPLLNKTLFTSFDQTCPKNVCLPINSYYCREPWSNCTHMQIRGFCLNGTCQNIVRAVKYVIIHNGTIGINRVDTYLHISNITSSFYQHFEVTYEWVDIDKAKVFSLSGNPGYLFEKPIMIGTRYINKTKSTEIRYIAFNKSDTFLTFPISQRNGECSKVDRYVIGFGENIKLKCSESVKTKNFSSLSCMELQNRTISVLMKESFTNITQTSQYNVYVSKFGNITDNNVSGWVQILLDRVPHNVVTGQLINDQIHCSGLVTSMRLDILYSTLSKPESLANHNILGVGITFSDEIDLFWPKCNTKNCTDVLKVDIVIYVMFHDISTPSKYYFVGGPNLDITLPYDFFYPFLRSSKETMLAHPLFIMYCVIFISIF